MFEPQNDLERSLMKAATEPAHRPQFYRDFLEASIFILPAGDAPPMKDGMLQGGSKLSLQSMTVNGQTSLPFFSSVPRIQAVLQGEVAFLTLPVRTFLEMTKGASLVLNPGSEYGKAFPPQEVAQMLDGSLFQPQSHTLERDTQVMLGQPAIHPTQLVDALKQLYTKLPPVKAAYLAQYFDPARDTAPGLLIAIDTDGDMDSIVSESSLCLQGLASDHDHTDFIQLRQSELQDYFAKTKPFYKKSFFSRFL